MVRPSDKKRLAFFLLIILAILALPYVYAFEIGQNQAQFGGFLLNPLDGNSYLAKMMLGRQGDWLFTLPYSAEQSEPAFLFVFYILLGHLSRWVSLPSIFIFHAARLAAAAGLIISLFVFFTRVFNDPQAAWGAFMFAAVGSGLGWLALPFGIYSSDFWVAEGYPFLSAYANPHFPLGISLLLILIMPAKSSDDKNEHIAAWRTMSRVAIAVLLALILPFGIILAVVILIFHQFISFARFGERKWRRPLHDILTIGVAGGPILLYQAWIVGKDAFLSNWNQQNQTATPPVFDLLISFSPFILASILVIWYMLWKRGLKTTLLSAWVISCLILIFFPWNLQRRFLTGVYIPLAGLAGYGLLNFIRPGRLQRWLFGLCLLLVIPTNLIVILAGISAARNQEASIYLRDSEIEAFAWIESNTARDDVFLASAETGLLIPAHTGRRVIYGHPYETANSLKNHTILDQFFSGQMGVNQLPALVKFIWIGPREKSRYPEMDEILAPVVYSNEEVVIYRVTP
jgi:hypothetical protein